MERLRATLIRATRAGKRLIFPRDFDGLPTLNQAGSMPSPTRSPLTWISHQPYLLLTLTPLFWAGNAVIGRAAAGSIAPATLSFLRWAIAFLIVLPFAWPHLKRDWPAFRAKPGLLLLTSISGISAFNWLQYSALEYTQALNVLLIQSSGPLIIAAWSFAILRARLSWPQLPAFLCRSQACSSS